LVEREYHAKEGRTLRVEGKDEAKKRLKRSPDRADVFNMLVEKAITLGRFKSEEVRQVARVVNNGWGKTVQKWNMSTSSGRRFR
jgi:hypothetical protein